MLARPQDTDTARAYVEEQPLGIDVTTNTPIPRPNSSEGGSTDLRSGRVSPPSSPVGTRGVPVWAAWVSRMAAFMGDCEGAYSLVALTKHALFGIRDPHGLRPLCIGITNQSCGGSPTYHLSSESCALSTVGASLIREVLPGEIVMIDGDGIKSWRPLSCGLKRYAASPLPPPPPKTSFCIFEYVYFSRPDSKLEGRHVHSTRTRLGAQLAREAPPLPGFPVDLVAGVPGKCLLRGGASVPNPPA